MPAFTSFLNNFFSILTITAGLLSVLLIVAHVSKTLRMSAFGTFFSRRSMWVGFAAALLATAGSLAYSDIVGYDPCKLCWFQRIFMYPQVVVLGLALMYKDLRARVYGIVLSVMGGLIAAYHYLAQLGWNPFGLECAAVGYSSSCAQTFVLQYGYITLPMMALSAFVLIALSLSLSIKSETDPA